MEPEHKTKDYIPGLIFIIYFVVYLIVMVIDAR